MSVVPAASPFQGDGGEPVTVRGLAREDRARWDRFVEGCPEATFCHLSGWQEVVERAFGHRTHYLYAESAGAVRGVLPLVEVKSLLFGHSLISAPFCVYGGIAAENEEGRKGLDSAARKLADRLGVDYLEFRNRDRRATDLPGKDLYVTFRKELDPDPEANLRAVPRKQRAMIRKGIKAGLDSQIDDDVDRLYAAYAESVRNLGTPVFPKRYFRILREVFGEKSEVLTVTRNGALISSVLSFYFRDEVLPYYGGGVWRAREVKGNDFMYWELTRRSCERGIRVFDYGRSKVGTGSYSFKKNWGFEPQPLHYQYYLVRSSGIPDVSPKNPKYRLLIATWKRLPLPVANLLGPAIAKSVG